MSQVKRYVALQMGVVENRRIREGEVFEFAGEKGNWMWDLDDGPAPVAITGGLSDIYVGTRENQVRKAYDMQQPALKDAAQQAIENNISRENAAAAAAAAAFTAQNGAPSSGTMTGPVTTNSGGNQFGFADTEVG